MHAEIALRHERVFVSNLMKAATVTEATGLGDKKEGLLWSEQPFAIQLLEMVAGVRFELTTFGL